MPILTENKQERLEFNHSVSDQRLDRLKPNLYQDLANNPIFCQKQNHFAQNSFSFIN
jgi:hypothetical protein